MGDQENHERRRELARLAEGALDYQIRVLDEHDAKTRHLLSMIGGSLGVSVALVGLLERQGNSYALAPLALAFLCFMIAFIALGRTYVGTRKAPTTFAAGWDPEDLILVERKKMSLDEIHRSTIHGVKTWFESNSVAQAKSSRRRRVAFVWLGIGLAFLGIALLIIAVQGVIPE